MLVLTWVVVNRLPFFLIEWLLTGYGIKRGWFLDKSLSLIFSVGYYIIKILTIRCDGI